MQPQNVVSSLVRGVLGAWLALGVEWLLVQSLCARTFAGLWEVQYGTAWLAPTALAASALVGVAVGAGMACLERETSTWALSVCATLGGALLGWGVSGGRHFEEPAVRLGLVVSVAALGGLAAHRGVPLIRRLLVTTSPLVFGVVLAAAALTLGLLNRYLLVRLYPAFHWALAVATIACTGLALHAWRRRYTPTRSRPGVVAAVVVATLSAAGLARPAAHRLAGFDNFRMGLAENAPLLGEAVKIAARLAPPPPMDATAALEITHRDTSSAAPAPSLLGRDVLLITIDALRADHVGAYGYVRPTTPNIDRLASSAVRFEYAYCPTPHTSYSVTSLLTGKYMRPLLLQGAGEDSETLASLLREYGYRTAAFYPPAVFFIDRERFDTFRSSHLGFEYAKEEFLEGDGRVEQVASYLAQVPTGTRVLTWVHLFGPHEPYEHHPQYDFGQRDIDRYDSEIRAADETVGKLVSLARKRDPRVVVVVTSDHGEEFGEHGGRYHGTSVYEEQVRVPLLIDAPGALEPRVVAGPVQTIDLMPTLLDALDVPVRPRIRGNSLTHRWQAEARDDAGMAHAATSDYALFARGNLRLICARRLGACSLYDLLRDSSQKSDISRGLPEEFADLKRRLHALGASHGQFEAQGLRAEGKGWPASILRGIAGDVDAAMDVAPLLDDADVAIRRKAAEVLFELHHPETAAGLRLALRRDEDDDVRNWCALALTRMGEGAPRTTELLTDGGWQRLAALALAESGDDRGEDYLVAWWMDSKGRDFERSAQILDALAKIRSKKGVWPLVQSLGDVRLRPRIARTLAAIGDGIARNPLASALARERYQKARVALARALLELGGGEELVRPLVRFLGVPDPIEDGLDIAAQAGVLQYVGGPSPRDLRGLARDAAVGAVVRLVIPKAGNGKGLRLLLRGQATEDRAGRVTISPRSAWNPGPRSKLPELDARRRLAVELPAGAPMRDYAIEVPKDFHLKPAMSTELVVFAEHGTKIEALAIVPLADELPPPPPKPWRPGVPEGDDPEIAGAGLLESSGR